MSAYAIARHGRSPSPTSTPADQLLQALPAGISPIPPALTPQAPDASVLDALIADLADRVAAAVATRLQAAEGQVECEWLDSRGAADYLGVHRDTLRKLAAERTIPAHQDGPGCKLFFRRSDLDAWRRNGGRVRQLSSVLAQAA
jgi:excisionase family DNA binding protein